MFETGVRQLRMALAMVRGRRIDPRNVERLVADALATLDVFGRPGDDVQMLLDGPFADPQARRAFQEQALRRTARRLARRSPHYRALFASTGMDPATLAPEQMPEIPATTKRDLMADPAGFLVEGVTPHIVTRTTGTTGNPVEIWLSRYEMELWPALAALSGLLRDEIRPDDCMQVNISSRATSAMHQNVSVCRLVGAGVRPMGIVPVEESLDSLLSGGERAPTLLATYPSYLAQLVKAARARGVGPEDLRLRRIDCGGEVLSESLERAARETLGAPVNDAFMMTEVLPVSARACEQGHLHHDLNTGFVEVIDLETGAPAEPGELGTVVITPYYPYRDCMPVFRHDTRDVVRRLGEGELTCSLAGVPATSKILGKAGDLLDVGGRTVTPRELVEACEALPGQPWPARYAARTLDSRLEVVLSPDTAGPVAPELRLPGVAVACSVSAEPGLRRVRADLLETTFTAGRA
jgi:phenylacetate-coenzyme A ligase PaaK-like adenylate-forming protein